MGGYRWVHGKALRFTAARRARYLEVLELTGNKTAAAEAIGFYPERLNRMRKRDPGFDAACAQAEGAATRRLSGAQGPFEGVDDGEFNTIRRCRNGRVQIIAVGPGRWSKRIEDHFFQVLGDTGNVEAAARAVGFAGTDMFRRRRQWPAFAERWDEVLEEAEVRLEFRLVQYANNVGAAGDSALTGEAQPRGPDGAAAEAPRDDCGTSAQATPFDPEFALRFLKWREEKRRGYGRRGRPRKGPPERTFKEAIDSVLSKVAAIERHDNRKKLEEGWSQDEEGRMIPPGWVRAEPLDGDGDSH